jgi:hypothetical protein
MTITFSDPTALQWPDLINSLPNGYSLAQINGVWTALGPSNKTQEQIDNKVQTSIDTYSILSYAKKQGINQIKHKRTTQYYLLYTPEYTAQNDAVQLQFEDTFGNVIDATLDMWASIHTDARTANTGWQKVLDTRSTGNTAINAVKAVTAQANAAATMAAVQAIIDAIVWPA